ncbi:MAG: hypothetical protein J5983_04810 [Ruminococcus sp.]|nr:hypothetical protein [Ruminococcus sp.]
MKNRILSMMAALLVVCSMFCGSIMNVSAEDTTYRQVDGSYLTTEESSSASTYNPLLRGEHLMDGDTTISKAGIKKVFVYAATTANHTVDYVSVDVYVEEYDEEADVWRQIDYWTASSQDDYYVSTQKTVYVDGGHYYRARSDHFAGNEGDVLIDSAYTFTDGIWVD